MRVSRSAIIAGNWKMHYGPAKAVSFASDIVPQLARILRHTVHVQCILCPPAISLSAVRAVLDVEQAPRLDLGAQNMYFEEQGAFTGELAPAMLHELCNTVILGHSERRMYFGETDESVNKKTQAALKHHLRPIVCIGENEQQHEAGQTKTIIQAQVKGSLSYLPASQVKNVVIAYEPIWAIGTGKAATAEGAQRVIQLIRELYAHLYGTEAAAALHILYGGSVTSANIDEFIAQPDIDGALVGGASIKADFVEIVHKTAKLVK